MKTVTILGSTGSVGTSTAELILDNPAQYNVKVLTAYDNVEKLVAQAKALRPDFVAIGNEDRYAQLKDGIDQLNLSQHNQSGQGIEYAAGRQAVLDAASIPADWTMAAISGLAGLEPLTRSIAHGNVVAIANKEPLVSAAPVILALAKKHGASLLPVDSEHNGVFQCFDFAQKDHIRKVILTASGGPFREKKAYDLTHVTPEQAIAHPNWSMGAKISVDSATMMNKALEVIEAKYLFDLAPSQIDVLIHPQSIVHAMVEYDDGSVLTHMGAPDMKTPIAHTLSYPLRMVTNGKTMDWSTFSKLDFAPLDPEQFPSVPLAYECLEQGQWACLVLNAVNEVSVAAFLGKRIGFLDIVQTNRHILDKVSPCDVTNIEQIIDLDKNIREITEEYLQSL